MTSNYLSIKISGFGGFVISLLIFSQLAISIIAKQDFASENNINTEKNLKTSKMPNVLSSTETDASIQQTTTDHTTTEIATTSTAELTTTTLIPIPDYGDSPIEIPEQFVGKGQSLAYAFELPFSGLLIKLNVTYGILTGYYSYNNPEPDEETNDGTMSSNYFLILFRPISNGIKKRNVLYQVPNSRVFIKIYGILDENGFSLSAEQAAPTPTETITDPTTTEITTTSMAASTTEPSTDNPGSTETTPTTDDSIQETTTDNPGSTETTPTTDGSIQETTTDNPSSQEPVSNASTQKPSTDNPPISTAPSVAPNETTTIAIPTTTNLSNGLVTCEGHVYNYTWKVSSILTFMTSERDCSKLVANSTGKAKWNCTKGGSFETPYPDVSGCSVPWIEVWLDKAKNISNIVEATNYMEKLENAFRDNLNNSSYQYFGQDIARITSMVDIAIFKAENFNATFEEIGLIIQNAVNINVFLIKYRYPWEFLHNRDRSNTSTYIFETTESALFNLTIKASGPYNRNFTAANVNKNNIFEFMIFAEKFNWREAERKNEVYEFPRKTDRGLQDSFIKLPPEWKKLVDKNDVEIAAMSMDGEYVSYTMPGQHELISSANIAGKGDCESKLINGKLISLTGGSSADKTMLKNTRMSFSGKGAEIVFYHDIEAWGEERQDVQRKLHYNEKPRAVLGTTQCVFWDTKKLAWSGNGCHIVKSNRFRTVCECSHLTSFAVLMDVHRYVGKQLALEILTLILCPLSEICLILSIVILSSVNNLQRVRTTITKNLAGCLFVGNALVLLVLDRNYFNMNEGLCIGSAMLTHYVFLCAFMWMLIEGVQLYRMVIHVFDSGKSYLKHFAVFAYGSPLLVVTITATTGYLQGDKPYGGDVYCWLEESYIWSFMGPVAGIIMINLVILLIALKTSYQLEHSKRRISSTLFRGKIRTYRTLFKGCFSLTCILGLTWVVGFFLLMKAPSGTVSAYIFTILNSSQGIFIFLFNCAFNDKVRSFIRRKISISTCLPTCLSSLSSNTCENGDSVYGKRSAEVPAIVEASQGRHSKELNSPVPPAGSPNIPRAKLSEGNTEGDIVMNYRRGSIQEKLHDRRVVCFDENPVEINELMRIPSNVESAGSDSTTSSNVTPLSNTSQGALIPVFRSKCLKHN